MFQTRFVKISSLLLLNLVCVSLFAQRQTYRIDKNITIYNDVMRQIDMFYVDTLNYDDLTETAINQMLRRIDPYTIYYPKKKDDDLRMMTTGKYGGIGSIIQLHPQKLSNGKTDTLVVIANPYEGRPAQRNGLMAGDAILSIDGWNAKGQTISAVSDHLRGEPGTIVKLKLQREGVEKSFEVSIEREDIHMNPVDYAAVIYDSIGYICFSEFTEGSALELQTTLYDLVQNKGAKSLILDLRGNGGGIIDEAVSILSNFIDKGTEVVSIKGKTVKQNRAYTTTSAPLYRDLPLTVLVDNHSASASEIVAGALQDLKRAKLIGQRTYGKGLVQNIRPVAHGGHVKITTAKYYLPSGRCIQAIDYAERQKGKQLHKDTAGGILPDIVIQDSAKVDVCYNLYTQNMFFDYATHYRLTHDSIASPLVFEITDKDIEDFCKWLEDKQFTYQTETSNYYRQMLDMARHEDIDSTTMSALITLEDMLKPDFRTAIWRNADEVREMLGAEIVLRYYYQKGRHAYMLRFDKEVRRAAEEI